MKNSALRLILTPLSKGKEGEARDTLNMTMTQVPEEIYLVEKRDEDQIIKGMRGEVLKDWVYTIKVWDAEKKSMRDVTSLSYAGVKEIIRQRGNIWWYPCDCCHKQVHTEETPEEIRAVVTAWDMERNIKFLGAASASKKQPFSWVLAVNKAERNALRKFLPEKAISLFIDEWIRKESKNPPSVSPSKLA